MPDQIGLLLEAEKRGILPPDRVSMLNEARKRGLVPASEAATATEERPLPNQTPEYLLQQLRLGRIRGETGGVIPKRPTIEQQEAAAEAEEKREAAFDREAIAMARGRELPPIGRDVTEEQIAAYKKTGVYGQRRMKIMERGRGESEFYGRIGRGATAGFESIPGYAPARGAIREVVAGEGPLGERLVKGAAEGFKETAAAQVALAPGTEAARAGEKLKAKSLSERMVERGHSPFVAFMTEVGLDPLTIWGAGAGGLKAIQGVKAAFVRRAEAKGAEAAAQAAREADEYIARLTAKAEVPPPERPITTGQPVVEALEREEAERFARARMGVKEAPPRPAVALTDDTIAAASKELQITGPATVETRAIVEAHGRVKTAFGNRAGAAINPAVVLDDLVAATRYIAAKSKDYFTYARNLVALYGPKVKPFIYKAWQTIKSPAKAGGAVAEKAASIIESGPARALKRSLAARAKQAGETFDAAMEQARKILAPLQEIHANAGFQRKAWQRIYDDARPPVTDMKSWDYIKSGEGARYLNGETVAAPPEGAKKFLDAIDNIQTEVGAGGKEAIGTKLRKDFGFTRQYLPEVQDAFSTQKGPMWEAIKEYLGTEKLQQLMTTLSSRTGAAVKTRVHTSLDLNRVLNLPMELKVNGKMVRTYEADLTKVVPAYFERGASRIEIGKMANAVREPLIPAFESDVQALTQKLGSRPSKEMMDALRKKNGIFEDDIEQLGNALKRGLTKDEQTNVDAILRNIQGEQTTLGKAWGKFGETKTGKVVGGVESVLHAKVLSGAGVTNTVSSWPLVVSEIGRIAGMKSAAGGPKAFARAYLPSWLVGKAPAAQLAENLNAIGRKLSTTGAIETSHMNNVSRAVLDYGTLLGYGNKVADEAAAILIDDALKVIGKDNTLLRRFAQDYHLTDAMMAEVRSGNMSNKTLHNIMDNFVNRVNPKRGSAMDLSAWHNDPLYKRVFPFITYARAGGNIAADVARAATEHGNWKPAVLFLGSIYGGSLAETFVKDLATGRIKKEDLDDVMRKASLRVPLGSIASSLQDIGYAIEFNRDIDMTPVAPQEAFRIGRAAAKGDFAYPVRTSFPGRVFTQQPTKKKISRAIPIRGGSGKRKSKSGKRERKFY